MLDACYDQREPVAYLWATEDTIYGRFGFRLASFGLTLASAEGERGRVYRIAEPASA